MCRRLTCAAVVLLVVLAAMMPSGRWYRCHRDGTLHAACCCLMAEGGDAAPEGSCAAGPGGCCDIVTLPDHPRQQVAAAAVDDGQGHAHIVATLDALSAGPVVEVLAAPPGHDRAPGRSWCGHALKTAYFQRFCALLI